MVKRKLHRGRSVTRRNFLKNAALFTGGIFISPPKIQKKEGHLIGLQLYTVRREMKKDLIGTLQQIADIGYNSLEAAGYRNGLFYGLKPEKFQSLVSGMGMKLTGSHITLNLSETEERIMEKWRKAADDTAKTEAQYLVYAYLKPNERKNLENYRRLADRFNKFAEICKSAGIRFAYHNHDFEFHKLEEEIPYDLLLKSTDKNLVKMELDLYWIIRADCDPVDYFDKFPGRFDLWHLKDMEDSEARSFTEIGRGTIDFARIFASAKKAGMKYFYVEQDVCKLPSLESVKISYDFIKEMDIFPSQYRSNMKKDSNSCQSNKNLYY